MVAVKSDGLLAPTLGSATILPGGTIEYIAGQTPGTDSFTYTVADANGVVSNLATVTVAVADVQLEELAIQKAQFRGNRNEWRIDGTSTVPGPGNFIEIYIGLTTQGTLVGIAEVDALGTWRFREIGSSVLPGLANDITIRSSGGATATGSLNVR